MLAETAEKYFQRMNCIPLPKNIISYMKDRFSSHEMSLSNLNISLPRTSNKEADLSIILEVAEMYKRFLNAPVSFVVSKYELWKLNGKEKPQKP